MVQAVQPTRLFFTCFGRPGQRSVASPIARGAKGSIRADTKIYIVRFNGGAQNDNPSISLGLACLINFGTCKKVDIRFDKQHFSQCFTTWNGGGEKNGACAGGAATEARSPSTVRQHLHGSLVEGVQHMCGSRRCREHANNLNNLCHPLVSSLVRFVLLHCESSVILHFWCPQINPNVGMLRCEP